MGQLRRSISPTVFDSIINKTPLSYKTNRIIGGVAPSEYLAKLEQGNTTSPPLERARLDGFLTSHLVDPSLLRADNFESFMIHRQKRLLVLIEQATGKTAYSGTVPEEGIDVEADEDAMEAAMATVAP